MMGYGTYNQPPGTWSDDSSLTLATVESIVRLGRVHPDDIMKNFMKWYFAGDLTPFGKIFDVGGTPLAFVNCSQSDIDNVTKLTHAHEGVIQI